MSDFLVEKITQALICNQAKGGLDDNRVYIEPSRQNGQKFVDVIFNALCTAAPVIMRVSMTLF